MNRFVLNYPQGDVRMNFYDNSSENNHQIKREKKKILRILFSYIESCLKIQT